MERYGISVAVKHKPALDPEFIPLLKFNQAFLAGATKPVSIAVEPATPRSTVLRRWRMLTTTTSTAWSKPFCG